MCATLPLRIQPFINSSWQHIVHQALPKEIEQNSVLHGLRLTSSVVSAMDFVCVEAAVVSMLCEEGVVEEVCARKDRKQWITMIVTDRSE
jgi:hypothetical protein